MQYKIEKYSDLDKAIARAHSRTQKYEFRIRKDIKGIKSSFAPLKLAGEAVGMISGGKVLPAIIFSLAKKCFRKKK